MLSRKKNWMVASKAYLKEQMEIYYTPLGEDIESDDTEKPTSLFQSISRLNSVRG
ncbi:hypothetical protein C427_1046 [Paraglaciecola psychrophila 170]|uniref:Uncharacterized protein n=1 Tax=Paraglaciecola psychrophila 170 TaxID=1129794 RepID=K7ADX5_9ALTE|nr:hypothetical protein C427_1046 [Paraglaciecola psychrophila 170]GAC38833.1 hypothetical protein GPSY_3222 [Paraglaciecola psychrophila 170]